MACEWMISERGREQGEGERKRKRGTRGLKKCPGSSRGRRERSREP